MTLLRKVNSRVGLAIVGLLNWCTDVIIGLSPARVVSNLSAMGGPWSTPP